MIDELEKFDKKFTLRCDALQTGINNVYDEFKKITDGSLLLETRNKIDKIKNDFYNAKRDIYEDVQFVKKCYKFLPLLSKLKDFDDEDFDRLIKILELMK